MLGMGRIFAPGGEVLVARIVQFMSPGWTKFAARGGKFFCQGWTVFVGRGGKYSLPWVARTNCQGGKELIAKGGGY